MRVVPLLVLIIAALGCSGDIGDTGDPGPDAGFDNGDGDGDDDPFDDVTNDADDDGIADTEDNCPDLANPNQEDRDTDNVGDACDCEPDNGAVTATLVLDDALNADRGMTVAATGFDPANWSYSGGRLAQSRLANDASDAILFALPDALDNLRIELTAASTQIADFGADDLRQLFVIARTSASAKDFGAEACGIEVVEGLSPTQKTSTITLGGSPNNVTTTVRQRTNRALVTENEDLKIVMDIRDGTILCTVTLDGTDVTTAAASTGRAAGAVGLYTRETKASFTGLKICKY